MTDISDIPGKIPSIISGIIDNDIMDKTLEDRLDVVIEPSIEGSELEEFESANIEEELILEESKIDSIIESILFASEKPMSLASLRMVFKGTQVRTDHIRKSIEKLRVELAGSHRGILLDEVSSGYQLRTKAENLNFITRSLKPKVFKLSGPALEVLAIVAYKQPLVKHEIDSIRGVESGHLLRALMEKNLVHFDGKSELPGKPMLYGTTKKFLEIFGLRNLKELPSISQIEELLPEGIAEDDVQKQTLSQVTDQLAENTSLTYSEGEEELSKISSQLETITTSSEFFEDEKRKDRAVKMEEKAQVLRKSIEAGEEVSSRDRAWLLRFETEKGTENSDAQT